MCTSVLLGKRIDSTRSDTVANVVRVFAHEHVCMRMHGEDHDPHESSIDGSGSPSCITCRHSNPNL